MILIEHASFDDATVKDNLGAPEYSYLFAKKGFRRVLERLGRRVDIVDPAHEADPIFHAARARGEDCVFLSFTPPHKTTVGLACPTVPVLAWEYDGIPDETWDSDPRNDWRYVLSRTGVAVTHCSSAAEALRRSMGEDFPVWVVPTPLFETFAAHASPAQGWRERFDLSVEGGFAIDAGAVDLSLFRPDQPKAEAARALRALDRALADAGRPVQTLALEGVVYTSVFSPVDGRKNWRDMIDGFVWAFRHTPTAALVLKLTVAELEDGLLPVLRHLSTLGEFDCRIVLICGLLSNEAYRALIASTSYALNTSTGEGQCLPLMEYMSCGRPAVAPAHTAMRDYLSPENGFVIDSQERPARWPHDERAAIRCRHHLVSFADLVRQYRESYAVARDDAVRYARMSAAATAAMRAFCSEAVAAERLSDLLAWLKAQAVDGRRSA
jgi:glycosyltransferase involved in cell wall biosynthesis